MDRWKHGSHLQWLYARCINYPLVQAESISRQEQGRSLLGTCGSRSLCSNNKQEQGNIVSP